MIRLFDRGLDLNNILGQPKPMVPDEDMMDCMDELFQSGQATKQSVTRFMELEFHILPEQAQEVVEYWLKERGKK